MDPTIRVDTVSKQFGSNTALDNVSLHAHKGSITGLVGPDGAGKTTLIRILAGLMHPSAGAVSVCGFDVASEAEEVHRLAGYMPQRFGLYEDLTVWENLNLYADLQGLTMEVRVSTFERMLHFTGLGPFKRRLAGKLSGGMKQKLGLSCALLSTPEVLLLDEPGVGVDPVSRRELWAMVTEMAHDGMAIVWSTAYLDEAEQCDEVVFLGEGKILYQGLPKDLTNRVQHRSYLLENVQGDRRRVLTECLADPEVRDGTIQGAAIRLVLTAGAKPDSLAEITNRCGATTSAATPRFEDAFIDLLGGGPGGYSEIADRMPVREGTAASAVRCEALTRTFGDFTATDNVSFGVTRGEIFGLLGPNGAGKSTTFKMLCGLLEPTSGKALVEDIDLRHAGPEAKKRIGYMAQKFSLYDMLTVEQNLDFFSGVYGLKGAERKQAISEMVKIFELQPFLRQSPTDLALGFKQRLALACALMHRPSVLFLDEPTSGVDPITRREFWVHITGLVAKGVTVMVTTHFMDEAEYCDRVALINQGSVIALDTPDGLKSRARTAAMPNPTMEDAFIELVTGRNVSVDSGAVA